MRIPILNLYYLLCYAWDMLEEGQVIDAAAEPFRSLPDLFARVLRTGVTNLLRRGLDRGYLPEAEAVRSPRGKLDLATTTKRTLRLRSLVQCDFDDFRPDVLHNRIIKSTLTTLARNDELDRSLRSDVISLCHRLHEVTPIDLSPAAFDRTVVHRHNRYYGFLIEVCRLLYHSMLVDPVSGRTAFRDFLSDERAMARLFERFVRSFYRREQSDYACASERLPWAEVEGDPEALSLLPEMRTDVTLRSEHRTVVIDTKYYASCLQTYRGAESVRSDHLYQLFAYLKNTTPNGSIVVPPDGILLYPVVGRPLDLKYRLHGHWVRVATVDLGTRWQDIRERLLGLILTEDPAVPYRGT
jgi:5-methylcytosine-specific restriction enzyme subunit McrC